MPAIVIEDLSPTVLAVWERRAAAKNRTVEEEVRLLLEAGAVETERLPMYVPSEETAGLFELPYTSAGIPVQPVPGGKRWPDRPVTDDDLR